MRLRNSALVFCTLSLRMVHLQDTEAWRMGVVALFALRSGVYSAWEAERALDAACAAIAVALNAARRRATAGHDGGRVGGRS